MRLYDEGHGSIHTWAHQDDGRRAPFIYGAISKTVKVPKAATLKNRTGYLFMAPRPKAFDLSRRKQANAALNTSKAAVMAPACWKKHGTAPLQRGPAPDESKRSRPCIAGHELHHRRLYEEHAGGVPDEAKELDDFGLCP